VGIAERLVGLQLPQDTRREIVAEISDAVDDLRELALEISPDCMDELAVMASAFTNKAGGDA
jgi:uncharacterized protein YgfB (UPF0149 family)